MIKGIIFDLGGTLIHFTSNWDTVLHQGAEAMATWYTKKKHIKLDEQALIEAFIAEHRAGRKVAEDTQKEVLAQQTLQQALTKIDAPPKTGALVEAAIKVLYGPEEEAYHPFPDAGDTLKILNDEGYRLGLYSNAPDDPLVQRLVNRNKLRPWLAPTFSSAGQGWRKPRREAFDLIAQRWALSSDQVVVVGDTLAADIQGAQNAGMHSILVTMSQSTANQENQHIQPSAVADKLSMLPEIIRTL